MCCLKGLLTFVSLLQVSCAQENTHAHLFFMFWMSHVCLSQNGIIICWKKCASEVWEIVTSSLKVWHTWVSIKNYHVYFCSYCVDSKTNIKHQPHLFKWTTSSYENVFLFCFLQITSPAQTWAWSSAQKYKETVAWTETYPAVMVFLFSVF